MVTMGYNPIIWFHKRNATSLTKYSIYIVPFSLSILPNGDEVWCCRESRLKIVPLAAPNLFDDLGNRGAQALQLAPLTLRNSELTVVLVYCSGRRHSK